MILLICMQNKNSECENGREEKRKSVQCSFKSSKTLCYVLYEKRFWKKKRDQRKRRGRKVVYYKLLIFQYILSHTIDVLWGEKNVKEI